MSLGLIKGIPMIAFNRPLPEGLVSFVMYLSLLFSLVAWSTSVSCSLLEIKTSRISLVWSFPILLLLITMIVLTILDYKTINSLAGA